MTRYNAGTTTAVVPAQAGTPFPRSRGKDGMGAMAMAKMKQAMEFLRGNDSEEKLC